MQTARLPAKNHRRGRRGKGTVASVAVLFVSSSLAMSEENSETVEVSAPVDALTRPARFPRAFIASRSRSHTPCTTGRVAQIPDQFICPITRQVMADPVATVDGHVYERDAIQNWFKSKTSSPNTNLPLESQRLTPIHIIRDMIRVFLQAHPELTRQGRAYVPKAKTRDLRNKMFDAVSANDAKKLVEALDEGCDTEATNDKGQTALLMAADTRAADAVKVLLSKGAYAGVQDSKGRTPLHVATAHGDETVARLLIGAKSSIDVSDNEHRTPLCEAAKGDFVGIAKILLEAKANASLPIDHTPLHVASSEGSLGVAKLFIASGVDIEAVTASGETPLQIATAYNRVEMVRLLVDSKANLAATNHIGNPLHYAISEKHEELTRLMIEWGAEIEARDRDGDAPLALAAMKGFRPAVQLLLERGADVHAKSNEDRTALHHAASQGHADLVALLLDSGAKVNALTIYCQTPLNRAAVKGRLDVTRLLVERKADIEITDRWGATAMFRAARNNRPNIVKFLIEAGADLDKDIKTAHGGDAAGNAPLHTAAWRGNKDVVEALLEACADYTAKNQEGQTPVQVALDKNKSLQRQISGIHQRHAFIRRASAMESVQCIIESRLSELKGKHDDQASTDTAGDSPTSAGRRPSVARKRKAASSADEPGAPAGEAAKSVGNKEKKRKKRKRRKKRNES